MVPIIKAIWRLGIPTWASCEDHHNNDKCFSIVFMGDEASSRMFEAAVGDELLRRMSTKRRPALVGKEEDEFFKRF